MKLNSTKQALIDLVKRKGLVSADDIVKETGLAKATIREHFIQLECDGYVDRIFKAAGRGRPILHYQLSEKGNRLFPSLETDLIWQLLSFLKERGEEHTIEDFFNRFWDERYLKTKKILASSENTIDDKMKALIKVLEDDGFMPEINMDDASNKLNVKQCNCPFSDAVRETRLPCKLEEIFLQKLFNQSVKRTSYIADGDYACNYEISLNQKPNIGGHYDRS